MPVADEPLGKICALVFGNYTGPKLIILRDPIVFIVTSKLVADDVCAKHDRGVHEGIQEGRRPYDVLLGKRRVQQSCKPIVLVDDPAAAAKKHDFGPDGCELVLFGKPRGMREIVGVLPGDPLPARQQ